MERKEKLEMLTALVGELGFSCDDVVNYWKASGKFVSIQFQNETEKIPQSPAPEKLIEVPQYQTPKVVTPGMFVYVDGLISSEIIEGRPIKAVVGSVNGSDVLAVCLQEACLPWSSDWLEAKATQKMTKGQEATRKLLEISRKKRQEAEAARWCYDYAEDGVKQGEAFLPSKAELEKLFANKAAINASLNALDVALLDDWYWSSTEGSNDYVWLLDMSSGSTGYGNKYDCDNYVRPVIKL